MFIDVSGDGIADTMVAMQGGAAGTVQLRALSETELELTLATDKIDKLTFAAVIDALETWVSHTATSTPVWTIARAFLSPAPPRTRRVPRSNLVPVLIGC